MGGIRHGILKSKRCLAPGQSEAAGRNVYGNEPPLGYRVRGLIYMTAGVGRWNALCRASTKGAENPLGWKQGENRRRRFSQSAWVIGGEPNVLSQALTVKIIWEQWGEEKNEKKRASVERSRNVATR